MEEVSQEHQHLKCVQKKRLKRRPKTNQRNGRKKQKSEATNNSREKSIGSTGGRK